MKLLKISDEKYLELYKSFLRIRKVELKIEELYHEDEMKTPIHLSLGQEAVAVGICAHLRKDDYVFSNHRSHAHYLGKGGDLKAMIAELYCKETGCSKGRGGSMHLIDTSVGLLGSSSIVGGSIPHAVGAAFASVYKNKENIAVTFFGDAAVEEGILYESMNFAMLKKLPVLFVCENNFYSVCSHISARQYNDNISERSKSFGIPSVQVDGSSLMDVYEKSKTVIDYIKTGVGPYFLECRVDRWRGHAGAGDPKRKEYRVEEDHDESNVKDPLKEFEEYMFKREVITQKIIDDYNSEIEKEIEEAFKYAQESPLPKTKELEKYLYS